MTPTTTARATNLPDWIPGRRRGCEHTAGQWHPSPFLPGYDACICGAQRRIGTQPPEAMTSAQRTALRQAEQQAREIAAADLRKDRDAALRLRAAADKLQAGIDKEIPSLFRAQHSTKVAATRAKLLAKQDELKRLQAALRGLADELEDGHCLKGTPLYRIRARGQVDDILHERPIYPGLADYTAARTALLALAEERLRPLSDEALAEAERAFAAMRTQAQSPTPEPDPASPSESPSESSSSSADIQLVGMTLVGTKGSVTIGADPKRAQKLREQADKVALHVRNWRSVPAVPAAQADHEIECRELARLEAAFTGLAAGWTQGTVPPVLSRLTARTQIEPLVRGVTPVHVEGGAYERAGITKQNFAEARKELDRIIAAHYHDPYVSDAAASEPVLTDEQKREIYVLHGHGASPQYIADQFHILPATVRAVVAEQAKQYAGVQA